MLVQLNISNFAIIKQLEVAFNPGLNILSGETGAGKSIIINAVNLILGARATSDLIRSGCREAKVEALFTFPKSDTLKNLLRRFGISLEDELLIKRTIFKEGRNRISINGSAATLQMLSRLGPLLISISGQHAHQLLLRPENHLYLLDDFGRLTPKRLELNKAFSRYRDLEEEIRSLAKRIRETRERQELSRFQIQEIENAHLVPEEDKTLSEERTRLQHAEELLRLVLEAYQRLYEREDSAHSLVSKTTKEIDRAVRLDSRLGSIIASLDEIQAGLEDVALALRDLQEEIRVDPERLEQVEERISVLNGLKRKYGPTLTDVVDLKVRLQRTVERLDEKEERLGRLEEERKILESRLLQSAEGLSAARKAAARRLQEAVEKELAYLSMPGTRFEVCFGQEGEGLRVKDPDRMKVLRADGLDQVEFMISPNVGEEPRSLVRIASGGELSRVMLALKTILAGTASVETIIFDEVDSGIGGAAAEVVGEKLSSLARYHQILCITHLPQIACKGATHFLVRKKTASGRTETMIQELDPEARVSEIARLLGGRKITKRALAHAEEMLG